VADIFSEPPSEDEDAEQIIARIERKREDDHKVQVITMLAEIAKQQKETNRILAAVLVALGDGTLSRIKDGVQDER
jgi:tellurite resistance protein